MTAAENVAMPLMFKGIPPKKRLAMARKELKTMGLGGRANHLPTEMSGGQQQRVGIARAFVGRPKVNFCGRTHRQPGLHHLQAGAAPYAGTFQTGADHLRHGHP